MNKTKLFVFSIGAAGVLLSIVLHLSHWFYAPYVLIGCSITMTITQLTSFKKTKNRVLNRLYSQQIIGSILLLFSGAAMFLFSGNEWIAGIAIAAFIYLYSAFRIPQEKP